MKLQTQMNNPSSTSSSSSTSITSLPRETLLKILTGLPAKSAVRFRCTSKFFYSFIPHPRFVFRILVSLPSKTHPSLNLYSVSYREESHGRNLQADTAQPLGVRGLVYSTDGNMCLLSCLSGVDDAVFDLSTGRRISLPYIGGPCGRSALYFSSCAVLGFDSVSERYKVFNSEMYYDSDCRRVLNHLWVLTLGVDKSWREIDSSTFTGYIQDVVHIHRIIYLIPRITEESMTGCWTRLSQQLKNLFDSSSFDSSSTEPKIVAMDAGTESFIRFIPIPFPSECRSPPHRHGWGQWTKLNGRLAFINIRSPQKAKSRDPAPISWPHKINVWTLKRSMKWEKQKVGLPLQERELIGEATSTEFTANSMGDIVFLIQGKRIMSPLILVYSFKREVWRTFEIPGVCNYSLSFSYPRGAVHVEDEIATFLE